MPPTRKPHRSFKPYCDYAFRIIWDGHAVAGISHVSALRRTTDVVEYREGGSGDTHKLPGRTQYDAITLERGVTHDPAFEDWARLVAGGTTPALGKYRKEVRIEVYDSAGRLVLAYNVHRAWPSEFVAIKELETRPERCLIQSLTLQHEGWERDTSVPKRPRRRR